MRKLTIQSVKEAGLVLVLFEHGLRDLRLTLDALVYQVEDTTNPQSRIPEEILDTSILVASRLLFNIAACIVSECPGLGYKLYTQ